MGLGSLKTSWQRQTYHFGHLHGDRYSVLVLDNRGMGDSDKPLMRYSTSEMARDIVEVLEHVGWISGATSSSSSSSSLPPSSSSPSESQQRSIHVAGISMGGMIAQELALLIPLSILSLMLVCSAAAIENTTSWAENMLNRASMLVPKSVEASVRSMARQLFPPTWLVHVDDVLLPDPSVPGVEPPRPTEGFERVAVSEYNLRFENRFQRFMAEEMHKRRHKTRFSTKGFLMQLVAAGWHHKSPEQLRELADRVGRDRIMVMHGAEDNMISVPHGRKLIAYLEPARGEIVEGMGHAPVVERWDWFNRTLEERIAIGEKLG
jgi:glycylpeptide N-tetradecanoyltransferase